MRIERKENVQWTFLARGQHAGQGMKRQACITMGHGIMMLRRVFG